MKTVIERNPKNIHSKVEYSRWTSCSLKIVLLSRLYIGEGKEMRLQLWSSAIDKLAFFKKSLLLFYRPLLPAATKLLNNTLSQPPTLPFCPPRTLLYTSICKMPSSSHLSLDIPPLNNFRAEPLLFTQKQAAALQGFASQEISTL